VNPDAAISALSREDEPRTWSLIVTLFGDLARAPGAEVPGPVLSAITGRIGVRPEAMRVALHRLRKDGWIASRRAGRVSYYRLTPAGRAEAEAASPRIYGSASPMPDKWHVLVAGPAEAGDRIARDSALAAEGYVLLASGVWLATGAGTEKDGFFRLAGDEIDVPDWLRHTLLPEPLAAGYSAFDAMLADVDTALGAGKLADLPDLDCAVLRVLIVHGWRRLVLRHPALPDCFFPDTWAGPSARSRTLHLLDHIGFPRLDRIGQTAASVSENG
jgi:phenylacetic acid degradation operon negative regulatory protein